MSFELVQDHADHADEDAGEGPYGNWILDVNNAQTKNAIAPAEAAGADKFEGMMKRDSPDISWKVAFKTMRKSRIGDSRVPSGFPQLWAFFHEARSLRVFQWGFHKYKELYSCDAAWNRWVAQPATTGEWHPQKLRASIWTHCDRAQRGMIRESTKKPYTVTKLQNQILAWTMTTGLWAEVPLESAPSKIRALRNWERVRVGFLVLGFVKYVAKRASDKRSKKRPPPSPCTTNNDELVEANEIFGDSDVEDDTFKMLRAVSSKREECLSPSLKRVCV